jgi:hypothetical protein
MEHDLLVALVNYLTEQEISCCHRTGQSHRHDYESPTLTLKLT